jgi:pimeloyl-ACP methyl ester carboxylesterase
MGNPESSLHHCPLADPTGHLAYHSWGDGETVMLLHGLGDHSLVWQSLAQSLAGYHCLAPDLPGHGDSSKPEAAGAYTAAHLAHRLEQFAVALDCPPLTVVAHSWAAKLALLWAQQQPRRVTRLVLVDPFFVNRLPGWLKPTLPLLYRRLPFLKVMGPFPDQAKAIGLAQGLKQYRGWSPWQQAIFAAAMEVKPDGRWGSRFTTAARNGVFQDMLETSGLRQRLPLPTLILLPEQGLNRFAWQLRPYRTYLPELRIQRIPGNHWPHVVAPDCFNQAVGSYLASCG